MATYTIDIVAGLVKKLGGQYFKMDMGIGAALQDTAHCKAIYATDPWDWGTARDLLFFEPGASVEFTFAIGAGEHGCLLVRNGFEVEVIEVDTGDAAAYIAKASDVLYSYKDETSLRTPPHRPVIGDLLYAGDMLDFPTDHGGEYKITNLCKGWRCFAPGKNEMPGLEEGLNEVNLFNVDEDPNQAPMQRIRIMRPLHSIRQISG